MYFAWLQCCITLASHDQAYFQVERSGMCVCVCIHVHVCVLVCVCVCARTRVRACVTIHTWLLTDQSIHKQYAITTHMFTSKRPCLWKLLPTSQTTYIHTHTIIHFSIVATILYLFKLDKFGYSFLEYISQDINISHWVALNPVNQVL